jgi:trigger factor
MSYMSQLSAQYGIEQNQLLQMLAQSGQLEQIFAEVQRSKALDVVLADVTVKNDKGDVLDLGLKAEEDAAEAAEDSEEKPAKKAPAKKAPAKKAAAKKPAAKKAEETDAAADAEAEEKAPAKKAPAKKAPAKKAAAKKPAAKKAEEKDEAEKAE